MAENFQNNINSLFRGMEEFITTKTVVGEPMRVGDAILIPLVDVSYGMMASAKAEPQRHNGGGGMGGKMTPSAVLVIQNGSTRVINIKNMDGISKVIDMAPDLINRFMPGKGMNPEVKQAAKDLSGKEEKFSDEAK